MPPHRRQQGRDTNGDVEIMQSDEYAGYTYTYATIWLLKNLAVRGVE